MDKVGRAAACLGGAQHARVPGPSLTAGLACREADRVILTMCQEQGAQPHTFRVISQQLGNKTPTEVSGGALQSPHPGGQPRGDTHW